MKLQLEKEIFRHLSVNLDAKFIPMLVMGHTTNPRPLPYISVECEDEKPFADLPQSAGLFEIPVNIAIADSAHDIDYDTQDERITAVYEALENFSSQVPSMIINSFEISENLDARDDNNIGNVLAYAAVVQFL